MNKKESAEKLMEDAIKISMWGEANPGDLKRHRKFNKLARKARRRVETVLFFSKIKKKIIFVLKKIGVKIPIFKKQTEIVF